MTTYTLTELFDKRSELAGLIIQAEQQARALRADLAHVEATIRILRPGIDLPKIVPRRVQYRPRYFKRGQLTRLILDYIREHEGTVMTVADIMPLVLADRVLSHAERLRIRTTVQQALHKLARRGTIQQIEPQGRTLRWRLSTAN
jgi:hypothetical protein